MIVKKLGMVNFMGYVDQPYGREAFERQFSRMLDKFERDALAQGIAPAWETLWLIVEPARDWHEDFFARRPGTLRADLRMEGKELP